MERFNRSTIIALLSCFLCACEKEPDVSIIPQIQLQSVSFKHEFPASPDTLKIELKFKDGDGDLGINGDETSIYQSPASSQDISTPFYYFYQTSQKGTWFSTHQNNGDLPAGYSYVNYASYRTIHELPFDTLPGALTCKNWEFRANPSDTLYIQQNPLSSNIFVYLYTKGPSGFTYFDPTDPKLFPFGDRCVTNFFNGRFGILASDLGSKKALEGTITYKIQSSGLYLYLHGKTIKLKIYILDRAFHKSNVVDSDELVIP